jgi:hypothetical protein
VLKTRDRLTAKQNLVTFLRGAKRLDGAERTMRVSELADKGPASRKGHMEASTFTTTTTLVVSLKSRFGGKVPGDADMDARSRAGDIIQIGDGAISPHSSYLGGVSFDEAPEPSTWALLLAGVAFLGFRMRNKIARFQA